MNVALEVFLVAIIAAITVILVAAIIVGGSLLIASMMDRCEGPGRR